MEYTIQVVVVVQNCRFINQSSGMTSGSFVKE